MKKQSIAITRKFFTLLVATALVFGSTVTSYASADNTSKNIETAEVTYKGLKDKTLVFKVDFKNEEAEPFQLIILNDLNEVIYNKKFEAQELHTNVHLADVPESGKLTFSITAGKKNYKQSFEINSKSKVVNEFLVKGI